MAAVQHSFEFSLVKRSDTRCNRGTWMEYASEFRYALSKAVLYV